MAWRGGSAGRGGAGRGARAARRCRMSPDYRPTGRPVSEGRLLHASDNRHGQRSSALLMPSFIIGARGRRVAWRGVAGGAGAGRRQRQYSRAWMAPRFPSQACPVPGTTRTLRTVVRLGGGRQNSDSSLTTHPHTVHSLCLKQGLFDSDLVKFLYTTRSSNTVGNLL